MRLVKPQGLFKVRSKGRLDDGRWTMGDSVEPNRRLPLSSIVHHPSSLMRRRLAHALESARPLWMAALLPLFVLGEGRYLLLGVLALALTWAATGYLTGVWWRRSLVDAPIVVLLALVPVTLWVTPFPDLTREHVGYFLAELAAFATVVTWATSQRRLYLFAGGLVAAGGLLALASPLIMEQTGALFTLPASPFHAQLSETIQKNVLGGILVILLPVSLGLLIGSFSDGSDRRAPVAFGLASLVMLGAIVYSQSRGAYLAGIVALLVLGAFKWKPVRLVGFAAMFGVAALALLGQLGTLASKLMQSDSVGDLAVRTEIWSRATQLIRDFPLTGSGMGTFRLVVPQLYPYVISDPDKVHHAHNLYLQAGADLGVPGLVAFLALVICAAVLGSLAWRRWSGVGDAEMAWLTAGCLAALVALLAHGFLDAVTWGTKPAFLAWAVLGLLVASLCSKFKVQGSKLAE